MLCILSPSQCLISVADCWCAAPQAFHCSEPGSRHASCLPLFLSLLTYEVYYQSEPAEGDTATQVSEGEVLAAPWRVLPWWCGVDAAAVSTPVQVPLASICYHGSRLVQALARFKERSLLLSSLRTLTPADLLTLASDPAGSHVLQALVTTASDKGRGKILRRMEVRSWGRIAGCRRGRPMSSDLSQDFKANQYK